MIMKSLVYFLLLALLVPGLGADPAPRIEAFSREDQFGVTHAVAFPAAKPYVLVISGQKGGSQLEGWISPIQSAYEERIEIAGVADLGGVPDFFKGGLTKIFKTKIDYPVMMDWSGEVAQVLKYKKGEAALYVIGIDGAVLDTASGEATRKTLNEVKMSIDRALKSKGKK